MKLGERLSNIHEETFEKQKQASLKARQDEAAKLVAKADYVMEGLKERLTTRAERGIRWGLIQRPVKTTAEHHPPNSRATRNVCKPEDLIEESALIYQRCVDDLGLTVQIRYWQEHDYDEPGAYHGGYEMVAVW